jgi:hypothetical protein
MRPEMSRFENDQSNFIDTINGGPSRLDSQLFAGDEGRILLGLKAHANTINHARLVAIEETFPRTRKAIGDTRFNTLSRGYCDTPDAQARDTNNIGLSFAGYMSTQNINPDLADLARIEWAWLESYNAADVPTLPLEKLAALTESDLLTLPVRLHPAAKFVTLFAPGFALIEELGDTADAAAILITRPYAEVRLLPICALTALVLKTAAGGCALCNLLEITTEQGDEGNQLAPIITLINAGAFIG